MLKIWIIITHSLAIRWTQFWLNTVTSWRSSSPWRGDTASTRSTLQDVMLHLALHYIRVKSVQHLFAPAVLYYSDPNSNLLSPQAQHSARTWQAALAPLWLFSATNYLMSLVSGLHRECVERKKKKKTKSLTHYTIDTAQFLYSTRWSKLSVEDSAVSSHDNQCLNHCLMQNSTFSYLSWNF